MIGTNISSDFGLMNTQRLNNTAVLLSDSMTFIKAKKHQLFQYTKSCVFGFCYGKGNESTNIYMFSNSYSDFCIYYGVYKATPNTRVQRQVSQAVNSKSAK